MKLLEEIIDNVWFQRCFWSVVVILFSLVIYGVVARFLDRKEQKNSKILSNKKNKTFIHMLKSIVGYVLGIFTLLVILQIFGVNVTSMLAGVGIASIVVGFALQDAMKDIFRGLDIISDGYYEIGDVIKYGGNTGQVLSISLRTTKIQDINTMNIVSIANRNIDQVEVVSGYIYIPIPLPYELKVEDAESVLQEIVKQLAKHDGITSVKYQGITALAESSLNYQIVVTCDPMSTLQIRRDSLRVIITTLESHKIHIPYTQLDLHTKK
ncbi:mechanosensitive ion channel family protein [Candidatus Saccharibacteria bacterium]|nr:mechanosensitive ion channel family protein [Candidatus Saccharibacteria bacterium]